ncbi:unnamed protein product [Pleuronectes platessa]|uniref:Uncharacterized protein n=1 Tax=Pleuronectes platessa TaxID=8262 RepID=A0A9N7Y846_PLEPL|nr:unnamed protein product [Pleuronectes platessa]
MEPVQRHCATSPADRWLAPVPVPVATSHINSRPTSAERDLSPCLRREARTSRRGGRLPVAAVNLSVSQHVNYPSFTRPHQLGCSGLIVKHKLNHGGDEMSPPPPPPPRSLLLTLEVKSEKTHRED